MSGPRQVTPDMFSPAALEAVEATGVDPAEDLERLRSGNVTAAELLEELNQGDDGDHAQGWADYVRTLESLARP